MKHPSYCIPNTLTILRNYWKHHENKQTTLQPVQPPQTNAAGSLIAPSTAGMPTAGGGPTVAGGDPLG